MRYSHIILCAFALVLSFASVSFADVEYARVLSVHMRNIVVERENGAIFELHLERGCPSVWRYAGRTIEIEYYGKFMSPNSVVHLSKERQQCGIRSFTRLEKPRPKPAPTFKPKPKLKEEFVRVIDVRGNRITVRRDNVVHYDVEIGKGCRDIARYRDRYIRATWTGSFLEYDARLFLPNTDQECRVRSSRRR